MSHSNCDLVATWQLSGSGHEQKFHAQFATRDTFPSRALGNSGVISEFSVVRPHSWILVSRANLAACLSRRLEFAGPGGESGGESLAGNSSALADGSARVKWKVSACSAGHALKIWLSHTRACWANRKLRHDSRLTFEGTRDFASFISAGLKKFCVNRDEHNMKGVRLQRVLLETRPWHFLTMHTIVGTVYYT